MTITASQVSELRKKTDCGMMDCKKALVEAAGDLEKAIELLRKKGIAKAAKRSGNIAAEGMVVISSDAHHQSSVMLEINSETDFVARDENFRTFAENVSAIAREQKINTLEALEKASKAGKTIEAMRQALSAKLGENIQVRRLADMETAGIIGSYVHGGGRIGVLVALNKKDLALAKDIAMHIAASKPVVILPDHVDEALVIKEKEICMAQALESGKPQNIIEKMVKGRLEKFVNEISLVGQPFVKDPNLTVGQLLKQHQATVEAFVRFELGEGIEKKETNFAEEVMAQLK